MNIKKSSWLLLEAIARQRLNLLPPSKTAIASEARQRVAKRQQSLDDPFALPPAIVQTVKSFTDSTDERVRASVQRRLDLWEAAKEAKFREVAIAAHRASPVKWINDWVWTYNPKQKHPNPATLPFDLFPRQIEFIEWLHNLAQTGESGVIEKSRDVGLTWLCVAYAAWQWLFLPDSKATFGSRKQDLVDRLGDPDSIFEKIRRLLKTLPGWQKPQVYVDGHLKFVNQEIDSTITGEAGDNMGRGGRSSIYFLDEFAFVERSQLVDAAVSENSESIFYVSTPNGTGNMFYRKRFSKQYPVFRIHWTDDPRKSQEWYQKRKAKLDPVVFAQEIDIDYGASIDGVCIPAAWVRAAIDLPLKAGGELIAGLDIADGGDNANVLLARRGPVVAEKWIQAWKEGTTVQTAYRAKAYCDDWGVTQLNYDRAGVGSAPAGIFESTDMGKLQVAGLNGDSHPSNTIWESFGDREAKEIFKNSRAERWWILRRRFEKTYEHVSGIMSYSDEELISLPNHGDLIAQISQPLWKFADTGKILIESKIEMKKRGIASPDFADALSYAFDPGSVYDFSWLHKA